MQDFPTPEFPISRSLNRWSLNKSKYVKEAYLLFRALRCSHFFGYKLNNTLLYILYQISKVSFENLSDNS
jgi:hypothetical protein